MPCQRFGCHTRPRQWPRPSSPAAPRAQPQVAAVAVPAPLSQRCSISAPSGARWEQPTGTQGSTGCWPTRETPHPLASSWEFNNHISPLDNCWRGQAGFPSLQTGVVQQFPTATQPMSQEASSDTAVWWPPPPVWLVTGMTWTEQNLTNPPSPSSGHYWTLIHEFFRGATFQNWKNEVKDAGEQVL